MRCPTCRGSAKPARRREKPAEANGAAKEDDGNKFHPFCSERCQLVDLGRWIGEEYRIPVEDDEDGGTAPPHGAS